MEYIWTDGTRNTLINALQAELISIYKLSRKVDYKVNCSSNALSYIRLG
jgi:hypothetical protein